MDSNTTAISATSASTSAISVAAASAAGSSAVSVAAANAAAASRKPAVAAPPPAPPKQEKQLQRDPRSLQFQVDGNRVISTIVDENNRTVVVQIPDADMIQLAKSIDRMQGFLVQEKA